MHGKTIKKEKTIRKLVSYPQTSKVKALTSWFQTVSVWLLSGWPVGNTTVSNTPVSLMCSDGYI